MEEEREGVDLVYYILITLLLVIVCFTSLLCYSVC